MTIAAFFTRHRRTLMLCAATVVLHMVTIDWLGARIGMASDPAPSKPAIISAKMLVAPQPEADAPPPEPEQAKASRPAARLHKPTPVATEVPEPAVETPVATAAEAPAAVAAAPEPEPPPATLDLNDNQPPAQASAAPQPPPVEFAQPPSGGRSYRVTLPPSARFELDVQRTDADGTNWSGSAEMGWQYDDGRYTVTQEVGVSLLIARVNLYSATSEGTFGDDGIAPVKFTEKRRNRSETATHFSREQRRITFSASDRSVPLLPGSQDRASLLFQLAGMARADINQFGGPVDFLVGEDRKAEVYRFQLVGEEVVETKLGKLVTLHLERPSRPGSYNSRLDVWLAAGMEWYPVQIRSTEASGAVTTQTVTRIIK